MSFLAELVPLSPLLTFPAACLLPLHRARRARRRGPSEPYARFDAHQQLDPEPVVGWPVERRLCPPCREVRRVDVRDDGSVRCFEHGHVTPATI